MDKNINGLDQEQEKQHKENYQVPDCSLLIENNNKENFPILVDVKSVNGDKQSCEIMGKRVKSLQNYARDNKQPLIIAIYWEKFGYWTHNCLKNFENKKNHKIHIFEAMIYHKFYRRTKFEKTVNDNVARHEIYGEIKDTEISGDGKTYKNYSTFESAIVDSMFSMVEVEKQ